MKSKLICLLLCAVLMLSVLTGCQDKQDETDIAAKAEEASRDTMTLTMWLVTEKETTDEAVDLVENAINKILKAKYKTRIELSVFTEDEYYAALEAKFAAMDAYIAEQDALDIPEDEETTVASNETVVNEEWGILEDKYPDVALDQLDIIYIGGADKYFQYSEEGILERLNDQLKEGSKKLNSYIDPEFFEAVTCADGGIYAIPNRHIIGEYAYLLTNRELVDKYYYDPDKFVSLAACKEFIEEIAVKEPGYTTIKQIDYPLHTTYWFADGERSLLASVGNGNEAESTFLEIRNVLTYSRYTDQLKEVIGYREKGFIAEDPSKVDKFGVAVIKGGAELEDIYGEDYYMSVIQAPRTSEEEMFKAMFGVTYYTKDIKRSMEVITLLNTDPEIRNLLQYGIENVHYILDEETGALKRLNNDYMMDIVKTGNVFMAYPEEGQPLDIWEQGKKQNLAALKTPFTGFTFYGTELDTELMDRIAVLSKSYFERLDACKTLEELNAFLDQAKAELKENEDMIKATSRDESGSPNAIYNEWHAIKYPAPEE